MKTILLQININESDYKKLTKYGFMLEKNINDFLHDIAEQIRNTKREKRKPKLKDTIIN